MRGALMAVLSAVLLTPGVASAQGQEEILLGVEDQLTVKIYQWPELSGEFSIGADGQISLPLVGSIQAAGVSTDELGRRISESLKQRARLSEAPEAAIAVTEYRPFYILGDVERPGAYPYRPGAVVLNAVSLAGGYYRKKTSDWQRAERDAIQAVADREIVVGQILRQSVRRARLEAELDGATAFEVPPVAANSPAAQPIIEEERQVMADRAERLALSLSAISAERMALSGRLQLIEAQIGERAIELEATLKQMESTSALVTKKLTSTSELYNMQSQASTVRRERKELEVQLLDTRQQLRKLDEEEERVRHDFKAEALVDLQTVRGTLDDLETQLQEARQLYMEATLAGIDQNSATLESESERLFTLVRQDGAESREMAVEATTAIRPGDIITVRTALPLPTVPSQ
ncbi:polysaccharide biosynthesis/export family protein [Maritimibacter alkaliphilus]|uniref:polysaccharide biosynthesis/export family protein n=1 Tax=Maritimibacter alkaliphilus TaxID=404236 RepID=UPI001C94A7A6|nr:polysaccharide biosynthesis/export family protein [Maritimibacter alkaliphilus]MBY6090991.1 polysaccharide biosynthesis/export family protein [Maritimibacter alkaliphilus]